MSLVEENINIHKIMEVLPHRYPLLLLDKIQKIERKSIESKMGSKIIAQKNVTFNELIFNGHFPGKPILPGVFQIEIMAQAGAALCSYWNEAKHFVIASVDKARFRKPVIPGDVLIIEAELLKARNSFVIIESSISVENSLVSQCEFKATATSFKGIYGHS